MINAGGEYEKITLHRISDHRGLKEIDAGMKFEEVCRQHGISSATYYNWKSKYGGMEASDVKRLKGLEEENAKLKKMFADVSLENNAIKELVAKKGW